MTECPDWWGNWMPYVNSESCKYVHAWWLSVAVITDCCCCSVQSVCDCSLLFWHKVSWIMLIPSVEAVLHNNSFNSVLFTKATHLRHKGIARSPSLSSFFYLWCQYLHQLYRHSSLSLSSFFTFDACVKEHYGTSVSVKCCKLRVCVWFILLFYAKQRQDQINVWPCRHTFTITELQVLIVSSQCLSMCFVGGTGSALLYQHLPEPNRCSQTACELIVPYIATP